jgi:hypothetical protein
MDEKGVVELALLPLHIHTRGEAKELRAKE